MAYKNTNFTIINDKAVKDEYDTYIKCPYDGCNLACPYWILLEGIDGVWCCSETWHYCGVDSEEEA